MDVVFLGFLCGVALLYVRVGVRFKGGGKYFSGPFVCFAGEREAEGFQDGVETTV